MRSLRLAVGFLTAIPVGIGEQEPMAMGKAIPWFPVVGAGIGALVGGVAWFATIWLSPVVGAVLAVIAGLLLTRGFHEDGLADTADGFGGGWSPEERMAIMKDSRIGTYGGLALVATVLVRVLLIAELPRDDVVLASIATHTLARSGVLVLMMFVRQAKTDGLGASYLENSPRWSLALGTAVGIGLASAAVGVAVLPALVAVGITTGGMGLLAVRKIRGLSGDVLGAAEQLSEAGVLLTLV